MAATCWCTACPAFCITHPQCDVACLPLQVGSYKFSLSSTQTEPVNITNREAVVSVFPAVSLADTSSMSAAMTDMAVGANATVTLWLNDYNGDAIIAPSQTTTISINGRKL